MTHPCNRALKIKSTTPAHIISTRQVFPNLEFRNPLLDYLKHDDEYNFEIELPEKD